MESSNNRIHASCYLNTHFNADKRILTEADLENLAIDLSTNTGEIVKIISDHLTTEFTHSANTHFIPTKRDFFVYIL